MPLSDNLRPAFLKSLPFKSFTTHFGRHSCLSFLHKFLYLDIITTFWQRGSPGVDWSDVSRLWLKIEAMTVSGTSLPALLFSGAQDPYKLPGHNFICTNFLKILNEIEKRPCIAEYFSSHTYSTQFKPALMGSFFQLQSKFSLPQSYVFRYRQVWHFEREFIRASMVKPSHTFHDILPLSAKPICFSQEVKCNGKPLM